MKHLALCLLLALLMTACGGGSTPEALPDPTSLLQKAADDIKNIKTLRFKLQVTGAPAFVDYQNTIAIVSADGAYVEPDRIQAKVVARLLGVPGEVEIVAIGDVQYMKNAILTAGNWLEQQFSPGFNAETLIRSENGIESAIRKFYNLKMIGRESLYSVDVYHLTGEAKAADISALTVDLIRDADVVADIYVNVSTGRVEQVKMVQPTTKTDTQDPTTWVLEIFDYNATDINIEKPAVANVVATPAFEPLRTLVPSGNTTLGTPTP
ncbi:MAG: LppX_LprAFG lipoprotein [Anaerolineae bacterium]|nr:LppX_LprAFG lipoprotein [Anaerolineae bacterium]